LDSNTYFPNNADIIIHNEPEKAYACNNTEVKEEDETVEEEFIKLHEKKPSIFSSNENFGFQPITNNNIPNSTL
jgi:hypothetical protein